MKLGLRLLLGFFVITGIAGFFVLRVFVNEVKPSVREVMEDLLVDTANILAELARDDLARMPAGGTLQASAFARAVQDYASRPIDVRIWGLDKRTLDYRVYVTDAAGRVVFDSGFRQGAGAAVGADYSRWNDVARTLAGRYGARATREVQTDDSTSVMYVAAPVKEGDRLIGVLTVAKPTSTVQPFIERAQREIVVKGFWLLGSSLLVGVLVTGWVIWSVRRLRHYALHVQLGERSAAPQLSGELGELAKAMETMQERLEGREHVENLVRALTHELKSPLTAIAGAAELLRDDLPPADRERFAEQIDEQASRLKRLVERLLELSKLEHRQHLDHSEPLSLSEVADAAIAALQARAQQCGIALAWRSREPLVVSGDAELLRLAIGNLVDNAIAFSPAGTAVEIGLQRDGGEAVLTVRDHGPGVPPYALSRLGERFYSTPRPARNGVPPGKGSGLGLAIVRQIATLHGGRVAFADAQPGLRAALHLPLR